MEIDVGDAAGLAEGTMRAVERDGAKVLLARSGGRCHAVGATCPPCRWTAERGRAARRRRAVSLAQGGVPIGHRALRGAAGRSTTCCGLTCRLTRAGCCWAQPVHPHRCKRMRIPGTMVILGAGAAGTAAAQAAARGRLRRPRGVGRAGGSAAL